MFARLSAASTYLTAAIPPEVSEAIKSQKFVKIVVNFDLQPDNAGGYGESITFIDDNGGSQNGQSQNNVVRNYTGSVANIEWNNNSNTVYLGDNGTEKRILGEAVIQFGKGAATQWRISSVSPRGGGGLKDLQCQVTKNGTYLGERFVGALSGIYFVTGSYLQQFTVSAGDTIAIQFSKSNSQSGGAVSSRSQYTIKQV